MTKSIHYEIKKIHNAVLIHVPFPEHWTVFNVLDKHLDYVCEGFGFCVCTRLDCSADEHINKLHAAIHAEFCGEWEPKKHEAVKDIDGQVREYIAKDENTGNHICAMRLAWDLLTGFVSLESVFPMASVEIPQGPCEVAYGVEGLEEGVQEKPRGMFDERANNTINGLKDEIKTLKHSIEIIKKERDELAKELEAAKEKAGTWTDEDMVSFGTAVAQIKEQEIEGDVKEWFEDWRRRFMGGVA